MNKTILRRLRDAKRTNSRLTSSVRAASAGDGPPNPAANTPRAGQIWICHDYGKPAWLIWDGGKWIDYVGGMVLERD